MKVAYSQFGIGWRANRDFRESLRRDTTNGFALSILVAFAIILLVSRILSAIDARMNLSLGALLQTPTAHAATLQAQIIASSNTEQEVTAGSAISFQVQYKNLGTKTWTYSGPDRVTLKASPFVAPGTKLPADYWIAGDTVARIAESTVMPGKTATYNFTITAPEKAGTYVRTVTLVRGGQVAWPESEVPITVRVVGTSAKTTGASAPSTAAQTSSCTRTGVFSKNLKFGDTNADVRALQATLQCLGYFPKNQQLTEKYGPITVASVKAFQKALHIDALGFVGPATRAALNAYTVQGSQVAQASAQKPAAVTPPAPVPAKIPVPDAAPLSTAQYLAAQSALAEQQFAQAQQEAQTRTLTDREKVATKYATVEALQKVLQQCSALRISASASAATSQLLDDCKQLGVWTTSPQTPVTTPTATTPGTPTTSTSDSSAIAQNTDPIAGTYGILGPTIRVGLYTAQDSIAVTADREYVIKDGQGTILATVPGGRGVQASYSPMVGLYTWTLNGVSTSTKNYLRFEPSYGTEAVFEITNYESRPAWNKSLNDNKFFGILELRYNSSRNRTWVINELPLEEYIKGLAESTNSSPMEYQKALLTAARTYAMHHYIRGTKHADEYYTVDATYDQVYKGYNSGQRLTQVRAAVEATRGQVVTYDNKVAVTPYFSWSDGRTRSWKEVWGQEIPWAQSVPEPAGYDKTTMFGHGVGMSARGAIFLAADQNYSFEQILKYYYRGIELKKIY